jgi:hypothetical protein
MTAGDLCDAVEEHRSRGQPGCAGDEFYRGEEVARSGGVLKVPGKAVRASWREEIDQNCGTSSRARFPPLLGGGLEPHFRVLFSAILHVFPRGISIRVKICGNGRKQKCGILWSIYLQNCYVF